MRAPSLLSLRACVHALSHSLALSTYESSYTLCTLTHSWNAKLIKGQITMIVSPQHTKTQLNTHTHTTTHTKAVYMEQNLFTHPRFLSTFLSHAHAFSLSLSFFSSLSLSLSFFLSFFLSLFRSCFLSLSRGLSFSLTRTRASAVSTSLSLSPHRGAAAAVYDCELRYTFNKLQHVQHTAPHRTILHHTASRCITLHHAAPRCTTLHDAATHYNTLQ